jgi:hypothetical protein
MNVRRDWPAKQRPDLHDPERNRAAYLALYRAIRKLLGMGATAEQVRRAFKLAAALRPWDTGELDDYELENIDSIRARALADALNGNPPNPIWGHDGPDTRDHG